LLICNKLYYKLCIAIFKSKLKYKLFWQK